MAQLISIERLEATINSLRHLLPPVNGVLSKELRLLAEIYGNMIYMRSRSIDLDQLPDNVRPMAVTLLEAATERKNDSSYDPNTATCDLCQ